LRQSVVPLSMTNALPTNSAVSAKSATP
jgi:hypothetical protein